MTEEIVNLPVTKAELDLVIISLENEKESIEGSNTSDHHATMAGLQAAMDLGEMLERFNAIRGTDDGGLAG
jgi:hypothetical protein